MDCAAEAADDARRAYHGAAERQQRMRLRRPPDVRPVELGVAGGLCLGQRDPHREVCREARPAGRRAGRRAGTGAGARLRRGDERSEARHRRRRRRRAPLEEPRDGRGGECGGGSGRQLRDREVRAHAVGLAEARLGGGREPARRQRHPAGAA